MTRREAITLILVWVLSQVRPSHSALSHSHPIPIGPLALAGLPLRNARRSELHLRLVRECDFLHGELLGSQSDYRGVSAGREDDT